MLMLLLIRLSLSHKLAVVFFPYLRDGVMPYQRNHFKVAHFPIEIRYIHNRYELTICFFCWQGHESKMKRNCSL